MSFFFILYGGLSNHFFAYYIGAPRSLSSLTICGPSDQFLLIQYGGPLRSVSLFTIWAPPPLRSVSLHAIGGATTYFSFFTNYMRAPSESVSPLTIWGPIRLVSLLTIWGPLRSVSVHTFWGPLSDHFSLTIWGLLRSVSSLTI